MGKHGKPTLRGAGEMTRSEMAEMTTLRLVVVHRYRDGVSHYFLGDLLGPQVSGYVGEVHTLGRSGKDIYVKQPPTRPEDVGYALRLEMSFSSKYPYAYGPDNVTLPLEDGDIIVGHGECYIFRKESSSPSTEVEE